MRIVLDTNALLRCISRRSAYSIILDKLYQNSFELYLTNDILLEYEEKVTEIFSKEVAELLIGSFTLLPNVKKVDVHFKLNLISEDLDDNKFSDCAFAGNVHFIVTNDKHFKQLELIGFPRLKILSLEGFKEILLS
jgi:uncharacterized protein